MTSTSPHFSSSRPGSEIFFGPAISGPPASPGRSRRLRLPSGRERFRVTGTPEAPLEMVGGVLAAWTGRVHGDLGIDAPGDVARRRRTAVDQPWAWLRQVHGAGVITVEPAPVRGGAAVVEGERADALVAGAGGPALAVFTADCAPLSLSSPEGIRGAVHAGWRGLRGGVVHAAVQAMRLAGATRVIAGLGPCIHAECYEFSESDLAIMVEGLGPSVEGRTAGGRPALDVPAAVAAATARAGAELVFDAQVCTACSAEHWSHRADRDRERQALVVWRP